MRLLGSITAKTAVAAQFAGQHMTETQAYEHMRSRATNLRVTVVEISTMVLEAHEPMEKLGLESPKLKSLI